MFKLSVVMTWVAVLMNFGIAAIGLLSLMFDYYGPRELPYYLLLVAGPLVTWVAFLYLPRTEERRLEKQVRLARLNKELSDLSR